MSVRRRTAWRRAAWLAVVSLAPLALADESPIAVARREAGAALVRTLEDLAAWAGREKLAGRRDAAYEDILRVDPDHAKARSALGYKREKNGTWVRRSKYVPPADRAPEALPEWESKVDAARVAYREVLLPALTRDAVAASPEEGLEAFTTLAALRPEDDAVDAALGAAAEVLVGDSRVSAAARVKYEAILEERFPASAGVHAALGHVRSGEKWVLKETVFAAERRVALLEAVQKTFAERPKAQASALRDGEKGLNLEGTTAWETPRVRLFGNVPEEILKDVAERLDRIPDLWQGQVGVAATFPNRLEQGSFRTPAEGIRYVEAKETLAPDKRKWIEKLQAWWLGDEAVDWIYASGHDDKTRHAVVLEGAFHRWYQIAILRTFRLHGKTEALQEGLATYLTWLATGTRYSWTVESTYSGTGGADPGKLRSAAFDWAGAAAELLSKPENATALRLTLPKPYSGQSASDALTTYAFAAYLVEGHDAATRTLLTLLGQGKDLDSAFREVFGADPERVQRRLARWCRESSGR